MLTEQQTLILEWTAVVLNLAFTIGIAYEKRWGWVPGFFASLIGVLLYGLKHTWALSALNIYYVVMGAYGWWSWRGAHEDHRPITTRPFRFHAFTIAGALGATAVLAWSLGNYLNGTYPQLDAFISVFSFTATWMMARKVLDNWLYWIAGDIVSVYLNWRIGYDAYALLNVAYIGLSVAGWLRWSRALRVATD